MGAGVRQHQFRRKLIAVTVWSGTTPPCLHRPIRESGLAFSLAFVLRQSALLSRKIPKEFNVMVRTQACRGVAVPLPLALTAVLY